MEKRTYPKVLWTKEERSIYDSFPAGLIDKLADFARIPATKRDVLI
jgi:hypothetical protein